MSAAHWWKEARIYELYVDAFAGDLRSLTERLDYLVMLGIDTLHILPHYPSPMVDQGYDVSDHRGVRPELGTLDDFKAFVGAAHAKGLRVMTDFVVNHVSALHPWFLEARASKRSSRRRFFLWSETGWEFAQGINAFPDIKPSNWIANPQTDDFYYATFYPQQADLNWDEPEVEGEMLAAMDFWADMGVDAFRLDAAGYLVKREGTNCKGLPETHVALKRIRAHLDGRYPRGIALLGESAEDVESSKAYFGQGEELHLMYHFPLMAQMWRALARGERAPLQETLTRSGGIPEDCAWANFLRNHDEIELGTLPREERLALVDALDPQHRYPFNAGLSVSLRLAEALGGDERRIREAFDMLFSVPGATVLYYGDEIGMRNDPVRPGVIDTRVYVRGRFDWDEAQRQADDPSSIFSHVAGLAHPASAPMPLERIPAPLAEPSPVTLAVV